MQMPALMTACENYLASTCFDDPEADPAWVAAVYDLACDLSRGGFAASIARHFACAAQRDAAGRRDVLIHILRSPPYAGSGAAQMKLLRQVRAACALRALALFSYQVHGTVPLDSIAFYAPKRYLHGQ